MKIIVYVAVGEWLHILIWLEQWNIVLSFYELVNINSD